MVGWSVTAPDSLYHLPALERAPTSEANPSGWQDKRMVRQEEDPQQSCFAAGGTRPPPNYNVAGWYSCPLLSDVSSAGVCTCTCSLDPVLLMEGQSAPLGNDQPTGIFRYPCPSFCTDWRDWKQPAKCRCLHCCCGRWVPPLGPLALWGELWGQAGWPWLLPARGQVVAGV